jgi:hypothetical protein
MLRDSTSKGLISVAAFSESGFIRFGDGVLLFEPSLKVLGDSTFGGSYSSTESLLLMLL